MQFQINFDKDIKGDMHSTISFSGEFLYPLWKYMPQNKQIVQCINELINCLNLPVNAKNNYTPITGILSEQNDASLAD